MDFKMQLDEFNRQLNVWIAQAKRYFGQLNDYEKYAWGAEGLGFVLVIVGVIFLF